MEDVAFTPGEMMPAAGSFEALLRCLGSEVRPLLKEFELFAHESVPKGYGLKTEVEGLRELPTPVGSTPSTSSDIRRAFQLLSLPDTRGASGHSPWWSQA